MKDMSQHEILLSVIMTNYNHGYYLQARLASILSQIPLNSEIVFVDDASSDDSVPIVRAMAKIDPRIRIFCNSENLGIIPSFNFALQEARGKYIASMAADDMVLPGFFEKTLTLLQKHPEVGIGCSDCASIFIGYPDKNPNQIYSAHLIKNATAPRIFHPEQIVKIFWTTDFWIPGHTAIVKRELLLKYGGFEKQLGYLCDWFLSHAIALSTGAVYVPETLSVWREEMKSYSHQLGSQRNRAHEFQMNLLKMLGEPKNRQLCRLFKKSGLLYSQIRPNLVYLGLRPRYWQFLWNFAKKYLAYRWRQCLGWIQIKCLPMT